MRDPNRIPRIIEKLQRFWEQNPDLRLGQLIDNAKYSCPQASKSDIFCVEDDMIEEGLDFLIERCEK